MSSCNQTRTRERADSCTRFRSSTYAQPVCISQMSFNHSTWRAHLCDVLRWLDVHVCLSCVTCLNHLTYAWAVWRIWITWRMPELCDVFESLDVCLSCVTCLNHLTCAWLCGAFWSSDVYPSYVMHLIHWRLFHLRDVVCLITWRVPACAIFINPTAKELNFILLSVLGSYVQWP